MQHTTTTAPDAVGLLAAERGFGALEDIRQETPMMTAVVLGFGTAAVSFAILWLTNTFVGDVDNLSIVWSLLRFVVWIFVFTLIWGIVYGLRGLIVGSRAHYLYAGGLVHSRRTGMRAVPWPDITLLKTVYNRRKQGEVGKVLGYSVNCAAGSFTIPLSVTDGRDSFIDQLVEHLREHQRPIQ